MSRIASDIMFTLTVRVPRGYQGFWDIIRDIAPLPFTLSDIEQRTNVRRDTVRDYVKRLERAGYIEQTGATDAGALVYRLVRNTGAYAPRLQRDGTEVMQGNGQDQMWRAMKMLDRFTARELAVHASTEDVPVKESTAKAYIKHLLKAGYLVDNRQPAPRPRTYRLKPSMNTGPLAPQVQRTDYVFDPNRNTVMQAGDGES